ncbi:PE-PPE domain-containing protein [Mycobacteroides chelonae]
MAAQHSVLGKRRSLKRSVATAAAVAATCTVLTPVAIESRTIASTLASYVIGVGGRGDGAGTNIPAKLGGLNGFYDPSSDTYVPVSYPGTMWPVDGLRDKTFRQSVTAGHTVLAQEIATHPGQKVIIGYSLGAVVVNESRKDLEEQYGPNGNPDIQFVLISNAYKPNGGILARFPGIWIPFMDIYSTQPAKPDIFTTTDITNEYDTIGDFPAYFNPLAIANALVAFPYTHPDQFYDGTDLDKYDDANAIADKTQIDGSTTKYYYEDGTTKTVVTNANGSTSTYYVVHTEHLPLLQPLRDLTNPIGASFVLDAIEPTLRVFIDMAYDRETGPGTVKPFSLFTPSKKIVDAVKKLPGAIEEGAENFQNGLPGTGAPKQPAQVDKTASPAAPQVDSTRATPPAAQTPAPTKLSDPAAIAVSASTVQAEIETGTKPEATPDENPDHGKPAVATVKDIDTSKNTTRPTLRLPKLPASRPGTTPKNPKLPSIREGLTSIPGLGTRNAPGTTGSGGTGSGPSKETVGAGNGGTAESGAHAGPGDHANSGDHGKSGDNHSGSNAA